MISIDAVKNTIDALDVSDTEWARRRKAWEERVERGEHGLKVSQGTLYKYVKTVADASRGCVTDA